jgi:hypothetical protein
MVPLINDAGQTLRWFVTDVWGHLDDDHTRPGAPLFCSERMNADGTSARVGTEALRAGLAAAAVSHLPAWAGKLTPHVLRHPPPVRLTLLSEASTRRSSSPTAATPPRQSLEIYSRVALADAQQAYDRTIG